MAFLTSPFERVRPLMRAYPLELAFALVVAVLVCVIENNRDNPYHPPFVIVPILFFRHLSHEYSSIWL